MTTLQAQRNFFKGKWVFSFLPLLQFKGESEILLIPLLDVKMS